MSTMIDSKPAAVPAKKSWFPTILLSLFLLYIGYSLIPPKVKNGFDHVTFGSLPVLLNGRVQPMDSVARNSLLQIRGQQDVPLDGNSATGWGDLWKMQEEGAGKLSYRAWWQFGKHPKKLKPSQWLMEVLMKPADSDNRFIFMIHHPQLLASMDLLDRGVEQGGLRFYTFAQLQPLLNRIEKEAKQSAQVKPELRNHEQKAWHQIAQALHTFLQLKISLQPNMPKPDFDNYSESLQNLMKLADAAKLSAAQPQSPQNNEVMRQFTQSIDPYFRMSERSSVRIIPPENPAKSRDDWSNMGKAVLDQIRAGQFREPVLAFGAMSEAFANDRTDKFNSTVTSYSKWLVENQLAGEVKKGRQEHYFYHYQPFKKGMIIYITALLLAAFSWLNRSQSFTRAAYHLVLLAWVVHTSGILFRMFLEGRPPVTNLYSSAVFVGWGAVILGAILERIFRNGIGSFTAATVGFITLIIAHNLAASADTMEMMRAVLDTNFWLATHVVIITLGYAATFLAGFLALVYILRGALTRSLDSTTAKDLSRMVYGIVCFATLFSFVGTILGGIWADQSWGRFWGWDVKENGALLIVIWNATILHARWGGMIKERGLMNMAIFGNVVTAFSWFGVNMLGIGLHSYGFMDAAFKWILLFTFSQMLLIIVGLLPVRYWGSGSILAAKPSEPAPVK